MFDWIFGPKDAEYNPAVKDLNCDFKPSNYAPLGLLQTHIDAFMPLFQCFDLRSLRELPLVVDFYRKMVRLGALKFVQVQPFRP